MRALPVITNSECSTYRRCAKEHEIAYTLGVRPLETAAPFRFGTGVHASLQRHFLGGDIVAHLEDYNDEYEFQRAAAMLDGYQLRWADEDAAWEVLAVEIQFDAPLFNPATDHASTAYRLGGKLDLVVRDRRTGDEWIVEHKTSAQDIVPGSNYWARLRLDSQISTYMVGARALGFTPRGVIYDVLGKPAQRPLMATPPVARKFTKAGALYANQRDTDETPAEYGQRVREAIAAEPDAFYQRGTVVRIGEEEREAAADTWHIAARIRESRRTGVAPRNPDACVRFNKICPYFAACTGETTLDNPLRYQRVEHVHQELVEEAAQ